MNLTTRQAAEMIQDALPADAQRVTHEKVGALVGTNALQNTTPSGRNIHIDDAEVRRLAHSVRYAAAPSFPAPVMRVSLIALREDEIRNQQGAVLRTHRGVDFKNSLGLSTTAQQRAWTGVWPVSDARAQEATDAEAILLGTVKGYVSPEHVRVITGWNRDGIGVGPGLLWWETREPSPALRRFVGTGLWVEVKPGRKTDWL